MKIVQLSTPFIPVPPQTYGGTELVVHNLTEGLVKRGHDVTLFAPGESATSAKLVSPFNKALDKKKMQELFSCLAAELFWMHSLPTLYHAAVAFEQASKFDIIHSHLHYIGNLLASFVDKPVVHTYHGDFDSALKSPIEKMILEKYQHQSFIAISESQKRSCCIPLNFVGIVHHGVKVDKFLFNEIGGRYLVWLGRVTARKGIMEAIKVAKRTKHKLVISTFVNPREKNFFDREIKPRVDKQYVVLKGPVSFKEKIRLFANARALLYPISWEEPFGLVLVEAMACGTPVIAYGRGSVPELVVDGEAGYIISSKFKVTVPTGRQESSNKSLGEKRGEGIRNQELGIRNQGEEKGLVIKAAGVEGLCDAVEEIYRMGEERYRVMRRACRARVEKYFTVEKMVAKYEAVYRNLLENKQNRL